MIETWPLDFNEDASGTITPRDQHLWDAVQEWANRTMGGPFHPERYLRAWVAVEILDAAGETYRVLGVTCVRNVPDVPCLHIDAGEGREHRQTAREARDSLVGRLRSYAQDKGFRNGEVLVHVSEDRERYWRGFLRLIGAKRAERWTVKI